MKIHKLRLKNIKSYGAGEDDRGIIINLAPGINQIAGNNGAGKSTIIEAIGYVLFDARPVYEDSRIRLNTYLLRTGEKNGEIDVWVEHRNCLYRVERDVGNSPARRWKVIRADEDFIEAEDETSVKAFLCRLAGVDRPERLPEVFHSLIGVKQGRFTVPFDSKTAAAKAHFDPLLDVDIFRHCYEELKKPLGLLQGEYGLLEKAVNHMEGQLQQLKDAPVLLEKALVRRGSAAAAVIQREQEAANLKSLVAAHEERQRALTGARLAHEKALGELQAAAKELESALQRFQEAKNARDSVMQTQPQYMAYLTTLETIRGLEKQRRDRDNLLKEQHQLTKETTRQEQVILALRQSAERDRGNAASKAEDWDLRRAALQKDLEQFAAGTEEHNLKLEQAASLTRHVNTTGYWLTNLSGIVGQSENILVTLSVQIKNLAGHDPEQIKRCQHESDKIEAEGLKLKETLDRQKQRRDTLQEQLASIAGGTCPFLKETCHQFDPSKVQHELTTLDKVIHEMEAALVEKRNALINAKKRLEAARRADKEYTRQITAARSGAMSLGQLLSRADDISGRNSIDLLSLELRGLPAGLPRLIVPPAESEHNPPENLPPDLPAWQQAVAQIKKIHLAVEKLLQECQPRVEDVVSQAREMDIRRAAKRQELEIEERALGQIKIEIDQLTRSAGESDRKAAATEQELNLAREKETRLSEALKDYVNLDRSIQEAGLQRDALQPAYDLYQQHKPVADDLTNRQSAAAKAEEATRAADHQRALAAKLLAQAVSSYDEEVHRLDQEKYTLASRALGEAQREQQEADKEVGTQEKRVLEMNNLLKRRAEYIKNLELLAAKMDILKKARDTLKDAQGPVAETLTRRIATRAQTIFNAMHQEPAQFSWESGDYKLTVTTVSGPKRFPLLSGGQQMKAALAMQLALVQEFSRVGFCAFDEPTYGLDAESRQLLAEAIAAAQEECRFEQLLLVSHDQSFDDKVEHSVKLTYGAVNGTRV